METRKDLSIEALALTALLSLMCLSLFATPSAPLTNDLVTMTGWLHVDDQNVDDVILVVEVDGVLCARAEVESSGRFVFQLPVNATARLIFQKPGHLEKEISVDTKNALVTRRAQRMNDKVRFDVVLESKEKRPDKKYEQAVGSIHFVNGSGTMQVRHDLRIVAK